MAEEFIQVSFADGIASVALNRQEKRNAMHGPLIKELSHTLTMLASDPSYAIIIYGKGNNFCAGGDLDWMKKMASSSETENYDDAQSLANVLYQLYTFPKPTIVLAHGVTLGGGLGLLAAADIAIAAKNTVFGLPEVKIGITPSIISPYVIAAIGERAAHYYFLTGERFGASIAYQLGLIQQITSEKTLQSVGRLLAQNLLQNSPHAMKTAKQLIRHVAKEKITEALVQKTAEHLAKLRVAPDAQEGLSAFIEKRSPKWSKNME